jgi:hypothetical protein
VDYKEDEHSNPVIRSFIIDISAAFFISKGNPQGVAFTVGVPSMAFALPV